MPEETKESLTYRASRALVAHPVRNVVGALKRTAESVQDGLQRTFGECSEHGLWPLTYPVLGNLSRTLQERIEEETDGRYDAIGATRVTCLTNVALYASIIYASYSLLPNNDFEPKLIKLMLSYGFICAITHPFAEGIFRHEQTKDKSDPSSIASFPGKVVSLPLEALLGAYDGITKR